MDPRVAAIWTAICLVNYALGLAVGYYAGWFYTKRKYEPRAIDPATLKGE